MGPKFSSATAAIIIIWLSVMLIGIFAPSLEIHEQGETEITVPVGAICAPFFAAIATCLWLFGDTATGNPSTPRYISLSIQPIWDQT